MRDIALSKEFEQYNKEMANVNVYGTTLDHIDKEVEAGELVIEMAEKRYEKGNRKGFPRKPTEETKEIIDARQYACYVSSIGFFKDKVSMGYTFFGYIPVGLKAISWGNGDTKVIREFNFKRVEA